MFETVQPAPPDAILGLTEAFKKDSCPDKVNLGVGVYKDDSGTTPVLDCVRQAESRLAEAGGTKAYLPINGSPEYAAHVQHLLFGADHAYVTENRLRTAHTPGGTGGLRVGADYLHQMFPGATVWVSTPTWANHKSVFAAAGVPVADYPYYDVATHGLNEEAMLSALQGVPAGDVVLLHVCCHNPTGVDPSSATWQAVADLAAERGWLPFLDFAYQGFGDSVEQDREALAILAARNLEFLVASSFSKNFGLYNERVGAFTLAAASADVADAAFSQVKKSIRSNYSNPPSHGGQIVHTVLSDPELTRRWREELDAMRTRIKEVRSELVQGLYERGVAENFDYIKAQRGMFSFSGLTNDQVAWLRDEKSIYIVKGGRINVAGITSNNLDYLCDHISEVLSK